MPNVAVLGSTGSIGRMALEVIRALGSEYAIVALAALTFAAWMVFPGLFRSVA